MNQNKVLDVLKHARFLITDPARWGKGALYMRRRPDGSKRCSLDPADADCVCAVGAYLLAIRGLGHVDLEIKRPVRDLLDAELPEAYKDRYVDPCVPHFNDLETTTHADVLGLFDRAIAKAEAAL